MGKIPVALATLGAVFISIGMAFSQTPATDARPVSFEVISIKPVERSPGLKVRREDDARIEYPQETVFHMLCRAYGFHAYQVSGPVWIKDNYYHVAATLPNGATKADIPAMLRQLLADRFHLSIRREFRAMPVYTITAGKDGVKLEACKVKEQESRPTRDQLTGELRPLPSGECPANRALTRGESSMLIEANTLSYLAEGLETGADRPVLDKTGLEGHFRIRVECAQASGGQEDTLEVPSMETALQKLGLKLEPRREQVEFLVVEGGDRNPSQN